VSGSDGADWRDRTDAGPSTPWSSDEDRSLEIPILVFAILAQEGGVLLVRCFPTSQKRGIHPSDEDLSPGTPDMGHPFLCCSAVRQNKSRSFTLFRRSFGCAEMGFVQDDKCRRSSWFPTLSEETNGKDGARSSC
jgi:hypothetical protein